MSMDQENSSSYFAKRAPEELARLMIQDQLITRMSGGPLSEQTDAGIDRVLDVGCGPGGWLLELADIRPDIHQLVGIDIDAGVIAYALACTQARQTTDRVRFLVMDTKNPLAFAEKSFDLIHMRFASSFLTLADWPSLLGEIKRIARAGSLLCITDSDMRSSDASTSAAFNKAMMLLNYAGHRAGYGAIPERWGVAHLLEQVLNDCGFQHIQAREMALEFRGMTEEGHTFYRDARYLLTTVRPLIFKHCDDAFPDELSGYDALYQQTMIDMQQPSFLAVWNVRTVWGTIP